MLFSLLTCLYGNLRNLIVKVDWNFTLVFKRVLYPCRLTVSVIHHVSLMMVCLLGHYLCLFVLLKTGFTQLVLYIKIDLVCLSSHPIRTCIYLTQKPWRHTSYTLNGQLTTRVRTLAYINTGQQ